MSIPSRQDKDAQISYLKETLAELDKMLHDSCAWKYDYDNYSTTINKHITVEDVDAMRDFIARRLNDVTY